MQNKNVIWYRGLPWVVLTKAYTINDKEYKINAAKLSGLYLAVTSKLVKQRGRQGQIIYYWLILRSLDTLV